MDDQMVRDNSEKLPANVVIHVNKPKEESCPDSSFKEETDEPVKRDMHTDSNNNGSSALEKPVHCFYFVKYPAYDDPNLKLKIKQAEEEVHKRNEARSQIRQELDAEMTERVMLMYQIKFLAIKDKKLRRILKWKSDERNPQPKTQHKLRGDEQGSDLCSSEQELNHLLCSLRHQLQHQSKNLISEKNIVKEIQELEGTREEVRANEKAEADREHRWHQWMDFYNNFSHRKSIETRNRLMDIKRDQIKMDNQATGMTIVLRAIGRRIRSLNKAVEPLNMLRNKAYETLAELQKKHERMNEYYHQNRILMVKAREHTVNKDIKALEELSKSDVESFMQQWNGSALFREDYQRRTLSAPDMEL